MLPRWLGESNEADKEPETLWGVKVSKDLLHFISCVVHEVLVFRVRLRVYFIFFPVRGLADATQDI